MDRPIFPFLDKSDLSDKMQAAFERSLEDEVKPNLSAQWAMPRLI